LSLTLNLDTSLLLPIRILSLSPPFILATSVILPCLVSASSSLMTPSQQHGNMLSSFYHETDFLFPTSPQADYLLCAWIVYRIISIFF
jgi:hypothetical protein